MQEDHPGTEELALRLDAYASARLAPDRAAIARMRAALIEEARMNALQSQIETPSLRFWPRRRAASLLLAASLTFASAAAVLAAAAPGGPLYGTRIWIESATLPSSADARAAERVHQIEERLADAERAAAAGDAQGVAAAIQAYRDAVQAALVEAGSDGARLERLRLVLDLHVTVLEALAGKVPDAALEGINRAIEASERAADRIEHGRPPIDNGPEPTGPAIQPSPKPGKTDGPVATEKPGKTEAPAASAPIPSTAPGGAPSDRPEPPASAAPDDQQG